MVLKADDRGFLIADSATDISDMVSGIEGVRADTSAILALLRDRARADNRREQSGQPPSTNSPRQRAAQAASRSILSVPINRPRDSQGRFVSNPSALELTPLTRAVESLTRQQAQQSATQKRADTAAASRGESPASTQTRDARGRFGSGGGGGGAGSSSSGEGGRVARMLSKFKSMGSAASPREDLDKIDPTVGAAREASQLLATPLKAAASIGTMAIGRGFGGPKDAATAWYQRIWSELRQGRRESSAFDQAQTRSLKEIERKTGGTPSDGKGRGLGGMLGGLLGRGGGMLDGLLGAGKGRLRRLPLLGALFAGGSALASIFGPDDPLKSAEQNRKDRFSGAGSGIGAILGGAVGSLLGPVGTVVGGILGDKVGEMVGGWLASVDWAQVGKDIRATWDGAVVLVRDSWNTVTKAAREAWDGLIAGAKAFIKDKLGIDIDAKISKVQSLAAPVIDAAKEKVAPVVNAVKDGAKAVLEYGKERVTRVAEPIGRAATAISGKIGDRWNDAKGYLVGAADKAGVDAGTLAKITNFESGFNSDAAPIKKDGTRISSAHGYGQFLDSTWTDMINKHGSKYGIPGAGELTKARASAYRSDKTIQAAMLAEFTRENIEKGRKYGGTNDDANVYAFHNLGDKDAKNLLQNMKGNPSVSVRDALLAGTTSDKERARIEKVISGNKSLYGDGSISAADAYNRMGQVMQRGESFAAEARASQAGTMTAAAAAPVKAAATVPPAFKASAPPATVPAPLPVPPAPEVNVPQQLNSDGPVQVVVADKGMAGQDLRDRRIAQIATGGLGA